MSSRQQHNVRCSSQPSEGLLASLAFIDSAAAELGRYAAISTTLKREVSVSAPLSAPSSASPQDILLITLREMGGFAGNISLQRKLVWDDNQYWKTRDSLVDAGKLRLGRGQGGSVRIVEEPQVTSITLPVEVPDTQVVPSENDLYEPVTQVLKGDWAKDNRYRQLLVEVTARQGRRATGGTWTRPDIVVAALRVFQYVPGRHFDVITFEIKPSWDIDVRAVYEALAHRRASTQAYVWLHVPEAERSERDQVLDAITAEAKRHGLGVIVGAKPDDYETWETLVDPERFSPDPEALNEFITLQLSEDAKQDVLAWIK